MPNIKGVKVEPVWLAVRFTHLPLESLGVYRDHKNIMVAYKNRVCAMTDNLRAQGLEFGMPIATAQILHNIDDEVPCRTYKREFDDEQKTIDKVCEALYNYTPYIELYRVTTRLGCEDIGVLLELSRCIQLFKGLMSLIEGITHALKKTALSYCYGQGHTKQMAWLLSYSEQKLDSGYTRDNFIAQLCNLNIDFLYQYPNAVDEFKKMGFFNFGDVVCHINNASMHSLRKRFGEELANYLADALGFDKYLSQVNLFDKPAVIYDPKKIFVESIQFDYPVNNCDQLVHPVKTLLQNLTRNFINNQTQTQTICWHMYDIYHNQDKFFIRIDSLHNDSSLAFGLTMIQFENQPLPFEIDVLELRCEKIFPVNFSQNSMYIDSVKNVENNALATVSAKLKAKLGEHSVFTLSPSNSHIPELSFAKKNSEYKLENNSSPAITEEKYNRPSWIFNIPVKAGKRQNQLFWKGKLDLLQGPERIEGLWWKKTTGRDYFVAKRDDHVRLWIFNDLYKNEWFVHGVFA